MKPITQEIRQQIQIRIKNKLDISDLIKDVDIRGENFSYSIIKDFSRTKCNMSNTNFSYAVIGEEGKLTNLSGNIFRNCIFISTKFLGNTFLRHCDCRDSNFNGAFVPNVEYQHTDFTNTTFCESVLRIGTSFGLGAKFDVNVFRDLVKGSNLEIIEKSKE